MKRHFIPITIGIVILCLMTWLQASRNPTVRRLRNRFEHLFYAEFLSHADLGATRHPPRVVIVDIDEESIAQIGRWPWPRSQMINLVNLVRGEGAFVVAFDIVFGEPDQSPVDVLNNLAKQAHIDDEQNNAVLAKLRPLVQSDPEFAKTLKEQQRDTILGFVGHDDLANPSLGKLPAPEGQVNPSDSTLLAFGRYFASIPILEDAVGSAGFMTGVPDEDGVVRRAPLIARIGDQVYSSLALQAARAYLEEDKIEIVWNEGKDKQEVKGIKIGKSLIHTDGAGQIIIPFDYDTARYSFVSASDLLNKRFAKDLFQGALVLVGSSSFRFGDLHATPMSAVFPGVEIQATIAESIVSGRSLYTPSWARLAEIIFTIILGLILAIILPFIGTLGLGIAVFLSLALCVGVYAYFFLAQGMVFAITGPVWQIAVSGIFNLTFGLIREGGRRKHLKMLFGQYVPQEHVELMSEHPEKYSAKGQSANLTVLFADIIGFTSVVQRLSAEETSSMLNQFFTPMTKIIFHNQGTIDKYVGDMIMAFWGAPIPDDLHVKHALEAALEMRTEIDVLKADFKARGLPQLEIGIGINTGDMFVGDMGSEFRRTYTVLGDAVNVASRVESLARYYGVHVIVGEATRANQDDFVFRILDRVKVVGRSMPLEIFELVSRKSDLSEEKSSEIKAHESALKAYFARDFETAKAGFSTLAKLYPEAKLYPLFLARVDELAVKAPPADWDGAFQWLSK